MPEKLSGRVEEMLNRNEFVAPFLRIGFIPYVPEFDEGVDFILYRERDDLLFKVQLKARWDVERKYFGRNLWMAFPMSADRKVWDWYLAPHDYMVAEAKPRHGHTSSWRKQGYSVANPAPKVRMAYEPFRVTNFIAALNKNNKDQIVQWLELAAKDWD